MVFETINFHFHLWKKEQEYMTFKNSVYRHDTTAKQSKFPESFKKK